jgi:C-terminal processing protease CtpA/Prc
MNMTPRRAPIRRLAAALAALTLASPAAILAQAMDPTFAEHQKAWTTKPEFSSSLVDHLPAGGPVPSPRDILGLVDAGTASAAEGFAFGLQRAGRATIIGQKTAGAGIAGSFRSLKDGLVMFVPSKLIVAPGTTEGWEGVGVIPDVVTAPGEEEDRAIATIGADLGLE